MNFFCKGSHRKGTGVSGERAPFSTALRVPAWSPSQTPTLLLQGTGLARKAKFEKVLFLSSRLNLPSDYFSWIMTNFTGLYCFLFFLQKFIKWNHIALKKNTWLVFRREVKNLQFGYHSNYWQPLNSTQHQA